ncbi:cytochrome c-type protein NapC [Inhella inkyongensis]|uniref:Cytochrome c-type protein n=1 Tax=Inhella inkyongensis TaxID=392593 RepID=A0A840S0T9_9BURK|nr:NapC/NirT family cytochrome c [Inhella inkyongensis]MBB5203393.1 cytochrome c-type protein NapC [Inhella inkyongensis]
MSTSDSRPGLLKRLCGGLCQPSRFSLGALLLFGVIAGVVLWGGFNTLLEATNKEAFCISCHEMKDNVYKEYSENTIHYTNRTGVRATCPDCHVPKEWWPKMKRKIQASRELYGKVMGTIDTREKFEAKRLQLAQSEWARMKANDSLECRNCHTLTSMDKEKQKPRAKKSHELAAKNNETCIDCHKGIAHHKPKGMPEDEE